MAEKEKRPYGFLRAGVTVFKVLAWVTMAVNVVSGLLVVIAGGEPVFLGGLEIPARALGIWNLVAAGVYFYSFWLVASLLRLLLDVRERLPG